MTDVARLGIEFEAHGAARTERNIDNVERAGSRAEKSFKRASRALAVMVGVIASMGTAIRTIGEFEASVAKLGAVTRASTVEIEKMRAVARDLGATTEFSATQAADGLTFLGMAGFSAAESIAAIPAVLDLATAAGLGLAQAADTASNIMSGFGIQAEESAQVADVLAAASSRANTDVFQLGEAMKFVGPVARSMGVSMSQAAAGIGVLSDAGIQGGMAGTSLRRVLSSLINPTGDAEAALQRMGVQLEQVNPQTNSLVDVVDTLAAAGLSAADALTIFGDRGGPAILALTSQNDSLRELTGELSDVGGEAERMSTTMRDTLKGDIQSLGSAAQGLILALGEAGLTAILRGVTKVATFLVRTLSSLVGVFRKAAEGYLAGARWLLGYGKSTIEVQRSVAALDTIVAQSGKSVSDLSAEMATGITMSKGMATAKLSEAAAFIATAEAALIAKQEIIRSGEAFRSAQRNAEQAIGVVTDLREIQRDRRRLGDELGDFEAQQLRQMTIQLGESRAEMASLLGSVGELSPMYQQAKAQVEALMAGIRNSESGMVILQGATVAVTGEVARAVTTAEALRLVAQDTNFENARLSAVSLSAELGVSLEIATRIKRTQDVLRASGGDAPNGPDQAAAQVRQATNPFVDFEMPEAVTYRGGQVAAKALESIGGATKKLTDAQKAHNDAQKKGRDLADSLMTPTERYKDTLAELNDALGGGVISQTTFERAVAEANKTFADSLPLVTGFGDIVGGVLGGAIKSFSDFGRSVLDMFKKLLIQMAVTAAKNRIVIGLGLGGSGVAGAASAATGAAGAAGGGLLGTIGGGLGAGLAGVGSGIAGGFASGGIGGAISGGIGAIGSGISGGLAAGGIGGIATAIGAALPVIGLGIALFGLFRRKRKPIISQKDFKAMQVGLQITGQELFKTSKAGQRAARSLKKIAGGTKKFTKKTEEYYDLFFTNEEKRADAEKGLSDTFKRLGVQAPETRKEFRNLVEGMNLTTKSGRKAYNSLLNIAPAFASVTAAADETSRAVAALVGRQSVFSSLQEQVFAATSDGYRTTASRAVAAGTPTELLHQVVEAIRTGNINQSRHLTKLVENQERAQLDPGLPA